MAPALVPGRRGRGTAGARRRRRPGARERGRSSAATSIPENGRPPYGLGTVGLDGGPAGPSDPVHRGTENHRPGPGRVPPRTTVPATGLACAGILATGPQALTARQTGSTKERRPTAGNLSFVGCRTRRPRSGSPGDVDRHRPCPHHDRSSVRCAPRPSCMPAAPTSVVASMRDVPAERRQESCPSTAMASSGRLAIDRSA